ncbi:antibiotic biosynthesis monooxygenase [Asanoa sp. NPDC049573]|uniref:antibiotic biosynthesis monooxygenase family protein n=1 Tax=Asanoa sp. NPDC049573 TaxID=3155396 RepID=UPI0034184DEF
MTLINTFTVDPARAEDLLETLSRATEQTMRHLPGFVSANLHVSDDRRHVANYAQWVSAADFKAIFDDPAVAAHMREAAEIAESFAPIIYELRESHERR